jgi:purine-nucleoside phosphorylase
MLKELTRADWLSILNLPERRVPLVLLLRGTRNLRHWYRAAQEHFTNVLELGTPNGVLDDLFVADLGPYPVAYASVYGAPMASEVAHVFGVLGTRLVIQIGNCGALADDLAAGDLFSASEACCGDGASHYYAPGEARVAASLDPREWIPAGRADTAAVRRGRIYTTSALLAEGRDDLEAWHQDGCAAVDLETAATFAVAKHFGMDRTSLVYVFDKPRRNEHILLDDAERAERRRRGNATMVKLVLDLIRAYGERR